MREKKATGIPLAAVWGAALMFVSAAWGFSIAWIYPIAHRILQRWGL